MISKEKKTQIIAEYGRKEGDTGQELENNFDMGTEFPSPVF